MPGEAPVTFQDFAAGFSVEEWKLLHIWQKELYRNLMKEIHKAFTSLGPLIAASLFSLSDQVKKGLSQEEDQNVERKNQNNHQQSLSSLNLDILLRHESDEDLKADHYLVGGQNTTSPFPGCRMDAEVVSVTHKEENEPHPLAYQDPEETQSLQCSRESVLFPTEVDVGFQDCADGDGFDGRPSVGSDKGMSEEASFILSNIKEEGVASSLNPQEEEGVASLVNPQEEEGVASSVDLRGLEIKGAIDDCVGMPEEASFMLSNIKEEGVASSVNPQQEEGVASSVNPQEEEGVASSVDHQGLEIKGGIDEYMGMSEEASFILSNIKEEGVASSVDPQEEEGVASSVDPRGLEIKGGINDFMGILRDFYSSDGFDGNSPSSCQSEVDTMNEKESHTCFEPKKNSAHMFTSKKCQRTQKLKRTLACTQCEKRFISKRLLAEHQRIHTGLNLFPCTKSEKSFNQKTSLLMHQKSHPEVRLFHCTDCDKSFTRKSTLLIHQRTHTGVRPYHCTDCEKSFTQKVNLLSHQRIHTGVRPFHCNECGKRFTHQQNLLQHRRIHMEERPFHCMECDKSFTRKSHLSIHQRTHTGVRPYHCTDCKKSFTQKSNLVSHKLTHTEIKPFHCTDCEKSFSRKSVLLIHQRIHSGVRPYHCPGCEKSFKQKTHLLNHQRAHSNEALSLQ